MENLSYTPRAAIRTRLDWTKLIFERSTGPNSKVQGVNPENGQEYKPDSCTYSVVGNNAKIYLSYAGGLGWEDYRLTAKTCETGTYELTSNDGYVTAESNGNYEVLGGKCLGERLNPESFAAISTDDDQEPNKTTSQASNLNFPKAEGQKQIFKGRMNFYDSTDYFEFSTNEYYNQFDFKLKTTSYYGAIGLEFTKEGIIQEIQNVIEKDGYSFSEILETNKKYYIKVSNSFTDYERSLIEYQLEVTAKVYGDKAGQSLPASDNSTPVSKTSGSNTSNSNTDSSSTLSFAGTWMSIST